MYVITGATGHTGRAIAETLLKAGQQVTALGQSTEKLAPLAQLGAKTLAGDLRDPAFTTHAFAGATAVYAMLPSDYGAADFRAGQNAVADGIIAGSRAADVRHVVALSTVGAHLPADSGVLLGLHDLEQQLRTQLPDAHVRNLRVGLLFENCFSFIPVIKHAGIVGGFPIRGAIEIPMVATQDIAAVAADRLLRRDFTGQGHEYVLGPRDLSFQEMTAIIGRALSRPELAWVDFSYADAKAGLMQAGFSSSAAEAFVGMSKSINEGGYFGDDLQRTPGNTTSTTFEDFVSQFAAAFNH